MRLGPAEPPTIRERAVDRVQRMLADLREGATETIVGRWLAQGGGRREQVVLAIRTNKPYVFTHAGLAEPIQARFDGVLAGFDGSEFGAGEG